MTKPIKKAKPIALPVPQQQVEAPTYDPNVVKADRPSQEETSVRNANLYHEWLENQDGLTDEERNKRDKSRAIRSILAAVGDGVSAIANLHGTTKYAPNMQMTSSLHSLQDRWDKEDKEGKEDARNKLSLYQQMQAAKRAEDEIKHRRDREKIADERYEEEKKYRAKKDAEAKAAQERADQWAKEKFNIELEADKARHEATLKNQRVIAGMRQQEATDKNSIPIFLSETEEVRIPKSIWNNKDRIAEVYEALPAELKQQAVERYATKQGKAEYNATGKEVQNYKPMTSAQMQQAIGAFLADSDAVAAQNLVRRMAGQESSRGLGWGATKKNTDDEQTDW